MRFGPRTTAASLLALRVGLSPVHAQTPPEQIRDWPGLTYLGVVAGLEAWSVAGSDALWMRAPDGRGLIRGSLFSAAGRDLGAALTGADPAPLRAAPAAGPDWSAPTPELLASVLRLSAEEAFALTLGEGAAPEVFAWMDLSDPATPATYMMLRDLIWTGEMSLRVIPVVTSDPSSSDLMLRAISSPGPLAALEDLVRGVPLPEETERDEERLARSEGLIGRIEMNGALASRISPPGLPFLVWTTTEGPAAFQGVPGAEVFGSVTRTGPEAASGADAPASD